jgi:Holliday junction resolvase RusA-like endonuclease
LIKFGVEGTPIPQGSMRHIGNGRMIHSRATELATWRALIANAAKSAGCKPIDSPIIISMRFRLKRPKTVKRDLPTVPPDLDKLVRGVLDGLTDTAYADDSQVIDIRASKVYSDAPGVDIEISDGFDCV